MNSVRPSTVTIYFRGQQVTVLKRMEVYTYTDFLAVCGGLFGLFLGISVLSIVEFLYYSTLRLYWTFQQWKSKDNIVPFNQSFLSHFSIDLPYLQHGVHNKNKHSTFRRPYILHS